MAIDIHSITPPAPQWLRVPEAVRLYGIGKSTLYDLMAHGKVRSSLVRSSRAKKTTGTKHGSRLINAESLDKYISSFATGGEATPVKKGARK